MGHTSAPPWAAHHRSRPFETVEEVLAGMDLPPEEWTVETAGEFDRKATGPDGAEATITDNVLRLRRHASHGQRPR
ncbi:MAG TPA: hypothetical protein VMM13_14675 [Euzebya sp.]|nr:hypothetical protein [Euzebya sp.]